jgi:pyruvate dehydrogenase E2 component (dihydrolipoamide acetyltransferase)
MATAVIMPKAGISVESCIITEWLKKPGDKVAVGDILFSYETDKASFECESTAEGVLLEIFYGDGDEVPVLVNVCAVGNQGEDVSALRPEGVAEASIIQETQETQTTQITQVTHTTANTGELKISPRAKALAEKRRIDITQVAGTGPYGRIIERDVAGFVPTVVEETPAVAPAKSPITAQAYEDIAFTGIRRAISKGMTASLRDIPQLTHNFSFDASAMLKYREFLKSGAEKLGLPNITLNDMILFAVSRLLKKHPDLNAHMLDANTLRRFSSVNLGMAVDTPRGLLVPVIKNADTLSLSEIATEAKRLAKAAQDGSISPDEMTGGTFTISNLGSFGVESFTPVINPPQTGILGVNNIVQRVKEQNGSISVYPAMGISLTYDHRAVDGAPASRFGQELCNMLAQFPLLLAL